MEKISSIAVSLIASLTHSLSASDPVALNSLADIITDHCNFSSGAVSWSSILHFYITTVNTNSQTAPTNRIVWTFRVQATRHGE
ncbi:unnamed protein product [Gongylonema pulchrum]|uniref:DUF11 domain-containing protein n=1 Tax=Gongylonema pulchrum TaxID=637853 RepID=A0A183E1N0_9BILA|nr:unnamed protein product [Gongylonema pulchrum]